MSVYRYPLGYSLEAEMRRVFAANYVSLVVDVGGHRGQFGSRVRQMGYRASIVSFEPGPEVEALRRRAEMDPKWRVVEAACGAEPDRMTLNVMAGTDFNSLHVPRAAQGAQFRGLEVVGHRVVDVVRLDQVLASTFGAERNVFLKSDTQGHDLEVLRGAEELWPKVCGVLVEASAIPLYDSAPVIEEMIAFMRTKGFVLGGAFPVSRPHVIVEFDCLFVRDPS